MKNKFGSERAMNDLQKYLTRFGLSLRPETEHLFRYAEELADTKKVTLFPSAYLAAALKLVKPFRSAIIELEGNPNKSYTEVVASFNSLDPFQWPYEEIGQPYSKNRSRGLDTRTLFIDIIVMIAKGNHHEEITPYDFIEAILASHDELFPPTKNGSWKDDRMRTSYNTLAHIINKYHPELFIRFEDIAREMNWPAHSNYRIHPAENSPPAVRSSVLKLFEEYPDYEKNCFIIMPFKENKIYREIFRVIKDTLSQVGVNALRADVKLYSDDLYWNVLTYLHGCKFGIAIFDRVLSQHFNPNVSLEIGYMLALRKPILLLKDQTLVSLPSDLVGKLYVEFDTLQIEETLPKQIHKWLENNNLR